MTRPTPEDLTAAMLKQELYVVRTSPARGPGIRDLLPAHLDYQIALERQGVLFGAGPIYPEGADVPEAGMIILRAASVQDARAIADADPLHRVGLRSYTVEKWLLNEGSITVTLRYSDQSAIIDGILRGE